MRRRIVHSRVGELKYEIREIVEVAREIERLGQPITWENIGDPVAKGEAPPQWIQDIVHEQLRKPASWGYCDTRGVPEVRAFLADKVNERGGVKITANDILFFNGLGDGVAKVYALLNNETRVLGPSPIYSTHASGEKAHTGLDAPFFSLNPANGWLPDVEEIRRKVQYNDAIGGICLLSPDNPTGVVYPRPILEEIAEIARQNDLFLIVDEIYCHIIFDGEHVHASQWVGDVPTIAMRGVSKEYPWPGGRCGWIEILNREKDAEFSAYAESLLASKRLEVCSTTLPQLSVPPVFGDARYPQHLRNREQMFLKRAQEAKAAFDGCEGVIVNQPGGALYFTVVFKENVLNNRQTLPIANPKVRALVESKVGSLSLDKRFAYYLMGATGIVTVPLTGFNCAIKGFRTTLLEMNDAKRTATYKSIREAIDAYLKSA